MEIKLFISLLALFFIVTFIQSGLDKLMNQEGNLSWFKSQFQGTFLNKIITPLFWLITIQELVSGGFLIYGIYILFTSHSSQIVCFGFLICMSTLIQLFTGQRIAKDYVGASGIVSYILVSILAIGTCFLFGINF